MNNILPASIRRLFILAAFGPALTTLAQIEETQQLPVYVTTATRTPQELTTTGSLVDTLTAADLARMQLNDLRSALGGIPGAPAFASGAMGGSTSLFLRGSNSNQTLFLVDGLRFNDPNTDYQVFFGGATLAAGDQMEILHGPQSTLYGGDAVGGVVALSAQRGRGAPTATVGAEAGSFGSWQSSLAAQGERGVWAYAFSTSGGGTQNTRANNDFTHASTSLRLDRKLGATVNLGSTLRWFHGVTGDPGDRYTDDINNFGREDNVLATVFAELEPTLDWSSRVTLGGQERRYVSSRLAPNPPYFSPDQVTTTRSQRLVLDWQATYRGVARHRITGGINGETMHAKNNGFGLIDQRQSLWAMFVQDEWTPVDRLYLTAGLRSDDFDTFGRQTTGRATVAWLAKNSRWKLRGSYGTAFRSPSFLDLYGRDTYYVGNSQLRPETSCGWDVGVDYFFAAQRGLLSATWFNNRFKDLITGDFSVFPSTVQNIGRARTQGLELAGKYALAGAIQVRLSYTYLEAVNQAQNIRLLRRPRQSGSVDVWREFGGGLSVGAGLAVVADRVDVHASTFATINGENYAVARIYGAWQATPRVTMKGRIENLLDERYEEVHGYPQPGVGVFVGVAVKF